MLAQNQNKTITCAFCGATAIYSTDDEKVVTDWDVTDVKDPCSVGCHVPKNELQRRNRLVKDFLHPEFKRMFNTHPVINGKIYDPGFRRGIV